MRHRKAIALIALIHVGIGLSVLLSDQVPNPDHAVLFEMLQWWVRGALWIGLGVFAATLAALPWHPGHQLAWIVLSAMPAQRFIGYLWSGIMYFVPGLPGGLPGAFSDALTWFALLLLIRHLAAWPDLSSRIREKEDAT